MDARKLEIGGTIPVSHEEISERLFGAPMAAACRRAQQHVRFHTDPESTPSVLHGDRRCISLYSATENLNHRRIDEARIAQGLRPHGCDHVLSSRTFFTLKRETRDLFVGRHETIAEYHRAYGGWTELLTPGEAAPGAGRIGLVDIGYPEVYYLSDAFLVNALRSPAALEPLVAALVENPETLVRVYDATPAVLLSLLYLYRQARRRGARLQALNVEVNSPEVLEQMDHKSFLHPELDAALELDTAEIEAQERALLGELVERGELRRLGLDERRRARGLLDLREVDFGAFERLHPAAFARLGDSRAALLAHLASRSQMGRMGIYRRVDRFRRARSLDLLTDNPGLNVRPSEADSAGDFVARCRRAAELLRAWFGFEHLCCKWAHSTDGENILAGIGGGDVEAVEGFARRAERHRQPIVVEAHTYIETAELDGEQRKICPSGLIIAGEALSGRIAPQRILGTEWVGNEILTPRTSHEIGIDDDVFELTEAYTESVAAAARDRGYAISIGGIDYCVCTLGGIFGSRRAVLPQDPNLRYTGSVPAHAIFESTAARLATSEVAVSTRKYVPTPGTALVDVIACLAEISEGESDIEALNISFTPTWAMFAVAGTRSLTGIAARVGAIHRRLVESGLAET